MNRGLGVSVRVGQQYCRREVIYSCHTQQGIATIHVVSTEPESKVCLAQGLKAIASHPHSLKDFWTDNLDHRQLTPSRAKFRGVGAMLVMYISIPPPPLEPYIIGRWSRTLLLSSEASLCTTVPSGCPGLIRWPLTPLVSL